MKTRPELAARKRPSQNELQSDSKTLKYEVENLFGTIVEYAGHDSNDHVVIRNACLESFAIHCRALIYFFYGHLDEIEACGQTEGLARLRENDVIAYDFDDLWQKRFPVPTPVLVVAKWQADKHIAHITTERREVNQPGSAVQSTWNLIEVASAICDCLESFLESVPPANFDPNALARIRSNVANWHAHTIPHAIVPGTSAPGDSCGTLTSRLSTTDVRTLGA